MNEPQSVEESLKQVKTGRGRKVAYLIGAAAAVALLIGGVIVATRGTDIEESSAAMADPEPIDPRLDAGAPTTP